MPMQDILMQVAVQLASQGPSDTLLALEGILLQLFIELAKFPHAAALDRTTVPATTHTSTRTSSSLTHSLTHHLSLISSHMTSHRWSQLFFRKQ
jgi:hypothetical protein